MLAFFRRGFVALVLLAVLLLLAAVRADAAVCGPSDGSMAYPIQGGSERVTCANGSCSRMYINSEGRLNWCAPWVKDGQPHDTPRPPDPEPDCQAETGFRSWVVRPYTCAMYPPAVPSSLARLPRDKHGSAFTLYDLNGPIQGRRTYHCRSGTWVADEATSTCGPVRRAP